MSRADQKDQAFLDIAIRLGELSTCDRAAVGAVIVRKGRAVSWGYNGAPPGMPHCDHSTDDSPCTRAIHAERNAVAFAAREGNRTDEGTVYVSVSPCLSCAGELIAAGIVRVVWDKLYRDEAGLNLLAEAGVELL